MNLSQEQVDFFWQAAMNDEFCDLYFEVDDPKQTFSCHKLIVMSQMKAYLSSFSTFQHAAGSQEGSSPDQPLRIRHVPGGSATFMEVLKFIYGRDDFQITECNVIHLLVVSDRLLMSKSTRNSAEDPSDGQKGANLKDQCIDFLTSRLVNASMNNDSLAFFSSVLAPALSMAEMETISPSVHQHMTDYTTKLVLFMGGATFQVSSCLEFANILDSLEPLLLKTILDQGFEINAAAAKDCVQRLIVAKTVIYLKCFSKEDDFQCCLALLAWLGDSDSRSLTANDASFLVQLLNQIYTTKDSFLTKNTSNVPTQILLLHTQILSVLAGISVFINDLENNVPLLYFLDPSDFLKFLHYTQNDLSNDKELARLISGYANVVMGKLNLLEPAVITAWATAMEEILNFRHLHSLMDTNKVFLTAYSLCEGIERRGRRSILRTVTTRTPTMFPFLHLIRFSELDAQNLEKAFELGIIPKHSLGGVQMQKIRILEKKLEEQDRAIDAFLSSIQEDGWYATPDFIMAQIPLLSSTKTLKDFLNFIVGKEIEIVYKIKSTSFNRNAIGAIELTKLHDCICTATVTAFDAESNLHQVHIHELPPILHQSAHFPWLCRHLDGLEKNGECRLLTEISCNLFEPSGKLVDHQKDLSGRNVKLWFRGRDFSMPPCDRTRVFIYPLGVQSSSRDPKQEKTSWRISAKQFYHFLNSY